MTIRTPPVPVPPAETELEPLFVDVPPGLPAPAPIPWFMKLVFDALPPAPPFAPPEPAVCVFPLAAPPPPGPPLNEVPAAPAPDVTVPSGSLRDPPEPPPPVPPSLLL